MGKVNFRFYYDSMIESRDLTYRVIGVPSATSGEDKPDKSKAEVILKDFIREPLSYSIVHSYLSKDKVHNYASSLFTYAKSATVKFQQNKEELFNSFIEWWQGNDDANAMKAKAYQRFVPWIDYFRVFQATDVAIPLTFNARLYPRYINKNLVGVKDQLRTINKYFIGGVENSNYNNTSGKFNLSESLNNSGLVYYPPHGYSPATRSSQGNAVAGTLSLVYGRFAVIEGLILTNYSATLSKELVRLESPSMTRYEMVGNDERAVYSYQPAYADVSITMTPATTFTRTDIDTILASDYAASRFDDKTSDSKSWLFKNGSGLKTKVNDVYYTGKF